MHDIAVYVKEGLPLAQDLSLENYLSSCLFFTGFTSPSIISFSSIDHLCILYAWFLILFHLT